MNEEKLWLCAASKRIAIANEVISLLSANKIEAAPGSWLDYPKAPDLFSDDDVKNKTPFFEVMSKFKTCDVCVLGALFVSAVRNYGGPTCEDVKDCIFLNYLTFDEIFPTISKYFPASMLSVIETAFEGWTSTEICQASGELHEAINIATNFYSRYQDANERMIAIMQNIVKNEGEFIPD